jgi:DNA replicative helicase MCM subunit Mcm2 (Cdc46/Mcm family)
MSGEEVKITIEDVKIAFKIINKFLEQIEEFERLASRLKRYGGRLDEKSMLMKMFMQQMTGKQISEEKEEEELTPEEIDRLKKVAEKYVK